MAWALVCRFVAPSSRDTVGGCGWRPIRGGAACSALPCRPLRCSDENQDVLCRGSDGASCTARIARARRTMMGIRLFGGLRPLRHAQMARDALAGGILASMNIPQVLGYARIAGMPVVTGLYTALLP